jgi:hypothetical protein
MAKVGRNDPCPCGSGEKFKRCHGAPDQSGTMNNTDTVAADHHPKLEGTWGISGIGMFMTLKRIYGKNPNDPRNSAPPSGSAGKYKVTFVLSRPGFAPLKENHISFSDDLPGDSHIFIGNPADVRLEIEAKLSSENLKLYGYPNEKGFLGKIEIAEVHAQGFGEANLKAYNALSIVLSRLSLMTDVPLHIYRITTIELATQNLIGSFTLPFAETAAPMFSAYEPDKDLANFASLYREALNSNAPNYQYLSFFKIIEGVRRILEERTTGENEAARAKGERPPSRPREILPTTREEQVAWLNSVLKPQKWSDLALQQVFPAEAVGKKINDLIRSGGVLDMIRNRIAHAVMRDETKETINIDDGLLINEVTAWLPLCKCMARYLLKKEYPQFFGS